MKNSFLIYGANGYTGQLITRHAVEKGLKPILLGRNAEKIRALAEELNLDYHIIDLKNSEEIIPILKNYPVLLNAAGPFCYTTQSIIDVCLQTQTHYLDITGEYYIYNMLAKRSQEFINKQIMVMPGVGFDVVPSDCLAKYLANKINHPRKLTMAIYSNGSPSQGTVKSAIKVLEKGFIFRINNILTEVPYHEKKIYCANKTIKCSAATWSDVVTAYYSTGIENISCYVVVNKLPLKWLLSVFPRLIKQLFFQKFSHLIVKLFKVGPSPSALETNYCEILMTIENRDGEIVSARLKTVDGYKFTALSAVTIIEKVLNNHFKIGFQTPSLVYGHELAFEIPGTEMIDVSEQQSLFQSM